MKNIHIIILVLFCISCNNQNPQEKELIVAKRNTIPEGYVVHNIELLYELGTISLATPKEYDTLYGWVNMSDICIEDKYMQRIANKNYSLLNENGAFFRREFDSVKQITIGQSFPHCFYYKIPAYKIDPSINQNLRVNKFAENPSALIEIDEIRNINGREIAIFACFSSFEGLDYANVIINFVINGQICLINCECICSDCSSFISEMDSSINTLQIVEGKGYLSQSERNVLSFISNFENF
jgi:hypothetical protein